jgi:hypothetical protein
MWLGSIQGRVGALDHLDYCQRDELLENKFIMSSQFKTGLQFGLQPVIFSSSALELFKMYLLYIRPKIMEGPSDPLFITFSGTRLRVGRYVTAFYKRVLGLHINTTRIRCIVETESAQLLLDGEISLEARDSVLNQNGHSSITSQKYYQKRSRTKDMHFVEDVHRHLVTVAPLPIKPRVAESEVEVAFGVDFSHPCELSYCRCMNFKVSHEFLSCDYCKHGWDVHGLQCMPDRDIGDIEVTFAPVDAAMSPLQPLPAVFVSVITPASAITRQTITPALSAVSHIGALTSAIIHSPAVICTPANTRQTTANDLSAVSHIGALHPCLGESGRRVTWTETEVQIVGNWCKKYEAQHGNNNNVVSNCLKYVLSDPELRQHFHPHHVMDSTRLRWGWQKYLTDSNTDSNTAI